MPLWRARNDKLVRWFGDSTNDSRRAWAAIQRERGNSQDFLVSRFADHSEISFVLAGDTGEGDGSQYAVVPGLERRCNDTDFMFICSDVIYPAGGINEYKEKFARPYRAYPRPIFAVPGNHDWYDDLTGFMVNFCAADPALRPGKRPRPRRWWQRLLVRLFWRRPPSADPRLLEEIKQLRPLPEQEGAQPGPYLAIDAGPVLLLGIDTGILGDIDRDQATWLRRISSESSKPKILLTGKPLIVDGAHPGGKIEGGGTVDEIVRDPRNNYVAAIGGDVHNYQRYPVTFDEGRTLQYVVSGGGGAFMSSTHRIPRVDVEGVTEDEFRCYPLRGDSLAMFSKVYDKRFAFGLGLFRLAPDQAAALVGKRLGLTPVRKSAREIKKLTLWQRFTAWLIFPLPSGVHGLFQHLYSEFLDWNEPPMFKNFLRIDATADTITITCFAATGCGQQEDDPPIEDKVMATRDGEGKWIWSGPLDH